MHGIQGEAVVTSGVKGPVNNLGGSLFGARPSILIFSVAFLLIGAAGMALAASLDFRKEGHFVKSFWSGDYWADEVLCGMFRSEWKQ